MQTITNHITNFDVAMIEKKMLQTLRWICWCWQIQRCRKLLLYDLISWIIFCIILWPADYLNCCVSPIHWCIFATILLLIMLIQCCCKWLDDDSAVYWLDQQTKSKNSISSCYWLFKKMSTQQARNNIFILDKLTSWEQLVWEDGANRLQEIQSKIEKETNKKFCFAHVANMFYQTQKHVWYQNIWIFFLLILLAITLPSMMLFGRNLSNSTFIIQVPDSITSKILYTAQILQEHDPSLSSTLVHTIEHWKQHPPTASDLKDNIEQFNKMIEISQEKNKREILQHIQHELATFNKLPQNTNQEPEQIEAENKNYKNQEQKQIEAENKNYKNQEQKQIEAENKNYKNQEQKQIEAENKNYKNQEQKQIEAENKNYNPANSAITSANIAQQIQQMNASQHKQFAQQLRKNYPNIPELQNFAQAILQQKTNKFLEQKAWQDYDTAKSAIQSVQQDVLQILPPIDQQNAKPNTNSPTNLTNTNPALNPSNTDSAQQSTNTNRPHDILDLPIHSNPSHSFNMPQLSHPDTLPAPKLKNNPFIISLQQAILPNQEQTLHNAPVYNWQKVWWPTAYDEVISAYFRQSREQ